MTIRLAAIGGIQTMSRRCIQVSEIPFLRDSRDFRGDRPPKPKRFKRLQISEVLEI